MKKYTLLLLLSFAVPFSSTVRAEAEDSKQPIQIVADRFDGDEVKQTAIYSGNVAVHQGTLEILGDKLVLSIDPSGYRHAVMTPKSGQIVTFKQRRDPKTPGIEEWMHGRGEKLTYSEKRNELVLTTNAHIARHENGKLKDESNGARIVYDLINSTAAIDGSKSKGSSGRVSTVIAPRSSNSGANTARQAKPTLQPSRTLPR